MNDQVEGGAGHAARNLQVVNALYAFLNAHNTRGVLGCLDAGVEWVDLPANAPSRGSAQVRDHLDSRFDAAPIAEYHLQDVAVDGDVAVVRFELVGAELGGLRADGAGPGGSIHAGIAVIGLRAGRVVSYRSFYDSAALASSARVGTVAALVIVGGLALAGFLVVRFLRRRHA